MVGVMSLPQAVDSMQHLLHLAQHSAGHIVGAQVIILNE